MKENLDERGEEGPEGGWLQEFRIKNFYQWGLKKLISGVEIETNSGLGERNQESR